MEEVVTVRDLQEALLEMLLDIDKICKKHDIKYFLSSGTLLGAKREHGFIPWDDDLDIEMLRSDYEKLLAVLPTELGSEYTFECFEVNKKALVTGPNMKIKKKNTYIKEVNQQLFNKCGCNGIFIDIFILNHVAEKKYVDVCYRMINIILMPIIIFFENLNINPIILKKAYVALDKYYDKRYKNSKYLGGTLAWTFKNPLKAFRYLYTDIIPLTTLKFESYDLPVPANTHNYLVNHYGKDYMVPKKHFNGQQHALAVCLKSTGQAKLDYKNYIRRAWAFRLLLISIIIFIIALVLFDEMSFKIAGIALIISAISLLLLFNKIN